MKTLDPKKIQELLQEYYRFIAKPREPMQKAHLDELFLTQIQKLKTVSANLDGSELETLKKEIAVLYELVVCELLLAGEAQNPQLANTFAFSMAEQESLPIRELRTMIPGALEALRIALEKRDWEKVMRILGGMRGDVLKIKV